MKIQRSKTIVIALSIIIIIVGTVFYSYRDVIFQRGNPIPYLLASIEINPDTPYVEVGENTGVYISQQGECPPLLDFIAGTRDVDFIDQGGNTYLFANETETLTISTEVYLRYFTVWTVSQNTLQTK